MNTIKNLPIGEYDKLVIEIRNNVNTRLADLMSKLLNSAQDKLFDLADDADNNEDQTRYFELMNQIRALKTDIASTFSNNIEEYLIPSKDYELRHKKENPGLDATSSHIWKLDWSI